MSGCANELFVGFLKETQKEARLRQNKQLVKTIQKVLYGLLLDFLLPEILPRILFGSLF